MEIVSVIVRFDSAALGVAGGPIGLSLNAVVASEGLEDGGICGFGPGWISIDASLDGMVASLILSPSPIAPRSAVSIDDLNQVSRAGAWLQ